MLRVFLAYFVVQDLTLAFAKDEFIEDLNMIVIQPRQGIVDNVKLNQIEWRPRSSNQKMKSHKFSVFYFIDIEEKVSSEIILANDRSPQKMVVGRERLQNAKDFFPNLRQTEISRLWLSVVCCFDLQLFHYYVTLIFENFQNPSKFSLANSSRAYELRLNLCLCSAWTVQ